MSFKKISGVVILSSVCFTFGLIGSTKALAAGSATIDLLSITTKTPLLPNTGYAPEESMSFDFITSILSLLSI